MTKIFTTSSMALMAALALGLAAAPASLRGAIPAGGHMMGPMHGPRMHPRRLFFRDRFRHRHRFDHRGFGWPYGWWSDWGTGYEPAGYAPSASGAYPPPPAVLPAASAPCPELLHWDDKLGHATSERLCGG
jgi:hypothetical protein